VPARPQLCYGGCAPGFGALTRSTRGALALSAAGSLGLSAVLPLFARCGSMRAFLLVGSLFGVAGTAQLTPASELLERAAAGDPSLAAHPEQLYARFNCAYVAGMAVGPSALAWLVQAVGARRGSALLAAGAAALAAALALALALELGRLERDGDGDTDRRGAGSAALLAEHLLAAADQRGGAAAAEAAARVTCPFHAPGDSDT
jgi:hypothetical protein